MRRALAALLLLPLMLAALLPRGFMPAVADDGGITVTLCTAEGLRTVTLDAAGQEIPDKAPADTDDRGATLCLFAGIGAVTLPTAPPDLPALAAIASHAAPLAPRAVLHEAPTTRLGARAPPVSA